MKKLSDGERFKQEVYNNRVEFNKLHNAKDRKRIAKYKPNTDEESVELFNYRCDYLLNAENLVPTQKYKEIHLDDYFRYIFGRAENFDFSNENITELVIPFEEKQGESVRSDSGDYVYNALILEQFQSKDSDKIGNRPVVVFKDLSVLESVKDNPFAITSPITYVGRNRTAENARYFYAFAVDLDYQTEEQIHNLVYWINIGQIPMPNIIVNSGGGSHLYYILEQPIPLYNQNKKLLNQLKKNITRKVWHSYTSLTDDPQFQPIFQGFRLPDTLTKFGIRTRAFVNLKSHYWTIEELNEYQYNEEYPKLTKAELSLLNNSRELKGQSTKLEEAKELWPEWYNRVVVNKEQPKYITYNRKLYEWWIKKLNSMDEVKVGHRFYCCLAAVAYATKCKISKEEVEKDLLKLVEKFDKITDDNKNHFLKEDVIDALELYGQQKAHRMSAEYIGSQTKLTMPKNKRNGIDQKTHLIIARAMREVKLQQGLISVGRPKGYSSERDKIKKIMLNNIDVKNKSKIARLAGVSRPTVHKHYEAIISEILTEQTDSLANIVSQ